MHQPNPNSNLDDWTWLALYNDGTHFWEVDGDGREHGFAEVDRDRLMRLAFIPNRPGLALASVDIDPTKHEQPILFRRRRIQTRDGEEAGRYSIHYIGVERRLNGHEDGQKSSTYIRLYEDGSIRVTDHAEDDDTGG